MSKITCAVKSGLHKIICTAYKLVYSRLNNNKMEELFCIKTGKSNGAFSKVDIVNIHSVNSHNWVFAYTDSCRLYYFLFEYNTKLLKKSGVCEHVNHYHIDQNNKLYIQDALCSCEIVVDLEKEMERDFGRYFTINSNTVTISKNSSKKFEQLSLFTNFVHP